MDQFRRKDRRGAVYVQHNGVGPTARRRLLPATATAPNTPVADFSPMPKIEASFDLYALGLDPQPISFMHPEFNSDYYCPASLVKLDPDSGFNLTEGLENRDISTISSISTDTSPSEGSMLSSVSTDGDAYTVLRDRAHSRGPSPLSRGGRTVGPDNPPPSFVCLGPQCQLAFSSEKDLNSHVKSSHTHICNWAGCDQPSFSTRDGLIYHVKVQHLVICPSPGCTETFFQSVNILKSHISMAHPEVGKDDAKEWKLPAKANMDVVEAWRNSSSNPCETTPSRKRKYSNPDEEMAMGLWKAKRQCQDRLHNVVEKRARKNAGTPRSVESPTDLIRGRASQRIETTSFPLVFEHSILPFLTQYLPIWVGTRHVVTVTRGKSPQAKRICIMAPKQISRARKVLIFTHVKDLIPRNFSTLVSLAFAQGEVKRTVTWARGLGRDHKDDICSARNPYFFRDPCMGDSIGVTGNGAFEDSTATLGPCVTVGGGNYWLGNFHPFLEAYQQLGQEAQIEHPSSQDRKRCVDEGHDAMAQEKSFKLGRLEVTSGLNLQTTRISHDPYWDECDMDKPLVVTDWALIGSRSSQANILRRFPSETQPPTQEPIVTTTTAITPGSDVLSSGRTSGYQRGQICEIPAYVSGDENQTSKATREWFIEEPWSQDDEDAWIRGGIGVNGDSGAGVVDANTYGLMGQVWGRNAYWGPGQRVTYFTPISDIFDDIQEKCGQQTRPQLPQYRDEANCFSLHPSCRQCFDLRAYLNSSRRSSRMSLQSMLMGISDSDQDLTSIEAVSELATPRDYPRYSGIEETIASLHGITSPAGPLGYPGTPMIADMKSPYATELDAGDLYETNTNEPAQPRKRKSSFAIGPGSESWKRQRTYG